MPKFVIERNLPGAGKLPPQEFGSAKRESLRALAAWHDRHVCLMGAE